MADSRHKHAAPRSRRRRSRSARLIFPAAGLLALGGVTTTVVLHDGSPVEADAASTASTSSRTDLFAASVANGQAPADISRSAERAPLPNAAALAEQVEGLRFATVDLEVHAAAKGSSPVLAKVASGDTVEVTGETKGDWTEITHNGVLRWVETASIVKEMPLGTSPCASGSAVESGLQPDTIKVHRAVCAKFPSIVSYGGVAGRGEHATGHALDIMVSSDLGNEIAAFLQENRAELGIEYLIWRQRIWRPATSPVWRGMSDRGGATANHMDHVHVTTYGSAATG